jgi:Aerotolerance regulator N-terminal
MISFLNSGILFLASAIVVPVLIYLFARKRPKRIVFSSIRFIKESQQQQKRKINLTNLLLLIIRMLIILLTILAISRPAIRSEFLHKGDNHPKTGIAIIIDNSYSMNYLVDTQTELDKVKAIALQINEMLSDDDQIILLTSDAAWNEFHSNPIFGKIPVELIKNIEITSKAVPLKEILELAETKIQKVHLPNREIILITDMQSAELPKKMKIPTFLVPTSESTDRFNISCQNSRIENEIVKKGFEKKISFELVNHSDHLQQDVIYRLFLDGNTVAEKVTDLQPNQRRTESFIINMEEAGWHSGYVEVKNERQIFDNRNYFSFHFDPEVRVAVLTDEQQIPLMLATILEIYCGNSENIDLIQTDNINQDLLVEYDNVLVYKKLFSEKLEFLMQQLENSGKGILYIADKHLDSNWKEYLAPKFAINFEEFTHSTSASRLTFFNKYHPITSQLKNIESVEINDFQQVKGSANALLKTGEYPIALEKESSCLWLFDLTSLQSSFLLDATFPVFAYNSLKFLSDGSYLSQSLTVGKSIRSNSIQLPNSNEIKLSNNKYTTSYAGIYKTESQTIPVNLDYSESNYARLEKPETKNLKILTEDWQVNILHSRYGFEIWKYLLIFVLILFALEMYIVKKEERK